MQINSLHPIQSQQFSQDFLKFQSNSHQLSLQLSLFQFHKNIIAFINNSTQLFIMIQMINSAFIIFNKLLEIYFHVMNIQG
jgi:hypothetical protein